MPSATCLVISAAGPSCPRVINAAKWSANRLQSSSLGLADVGTWRHGSGNSAQWSSMWTSPPYSFPVDSPGRTNLKRYQVKPGRKYMSIGAYPGNTSFPSRSSALVAETSRSSVCPSIAPTAFMLAHTGSIPVRIDWSAGGSKTSR